MGTWVVFSQVIFYYLTKVVIRLSVNRLPVKLPITGFNFQLPITYLPTSCTQANKDRSTLDQDIPSPSDGLVPLVHVNPAFDCLSVESAPLCYPVLFTLTITITKIEK